MLSRLSRASRSLNSLWAPALWSGAAGSVPHVAQIIQPSQSRHNHSENTNKFIKEVRGDIAALRQLSVCSVTQHMPDRALWRRRTCTRRHGPGHSPTSAFTSSFIQAIDVLGVDNNIMKILLTPAREVTVELIITMDNGMAESFSGFRVQHNNSRGPFKGGLRYHPQVDMDDVKRCFSTAVLLSLCLDLPFVHTSIQVILPPL